MKLSSLLVLLSFAVHRAWTQQCNIFSGPSGNTECVRVRGYFGYQWATCLTNAYIQQKSNKRHICSIRFARFCWYQCMIEVHNRVSGFVTNDCSCTPGQATAKPYTTAASLPPLCYSPSGDSCSWFQNCLEKKYPCKDTSNAYAIKYAEKFCRLYDERSSLFSTEGRKWVNATRKCLQVSLVPILRPWYTLSCENIRKRAFASHTPCYLNPDKDAPSICNMDCNDFLKIFWTIKSSFIPLDTSWETLKGLWNIGSRCKVSSQISNCFKEDEGNLTKKVIKISKIVVKSFKKFPNRDRQSLSDPVPEADARSRFADRVGSAIAKALMWNTTVMDWLAYSETANPANDPDISNIVIVSVDKKALGIVSTSIPAINFNQTTEEFSSAVAEGKLTLQVDGHNVWVKSLASCFDKSCLRTRVLALASCFDKSCESTHTPYSVPALAVSDRPLKRNSSVRIVHNFMGLYGFTAALAIFLNKL